ncbi:MAG: hypothetical protein V4686_00220 [Patescibacteria group bacterium]
MKKTIQVLAFAVVAIVAPHIHAGVVENKVVTLLSQTLINETVDSAVSFDIGVNAKTTTTQVGEKTKTENMSGSANFVAISNVATKLSQVKGNISLKAPQLPQAISLPLQVISQEDSTNKATVYFLMYPEYSVIAKMFLGTDALDKISGKWIKVSSGEFFNQTKSSPEKDSARAKYKSVWNNTTWFTAKSLKNGNVTTYTIKPNPAVLYAKLEKSGAFTTSSYTTPAEKAKKKAAILSMLRNAVIQLDEKDGKLAGYRVTFSITDKNTSSTYNSKNKKVAVTDTTFANVTIKGALLPNQIITLPAASDTLTQEALENLMSSPSTIRGY